MSRQATAIYENGVLRLLSPVALPERTRVRVQIIRDDEPEDELRLSEAALIEAGLIKPHGPQPPLTRVTPARRAELARLYAEGGPLSEAIIAERDAR